MLLVVVLMMSMGLMGCKGKESTKKKKQIQPRKMEKRPRQQKKRLNYS